MQFTSDWFSHNVAAWSVIVPRYDPSRILEIGSYEGRSTCWLIETLASKHPLELACIDYWEDNADSEARNQDMGAAEWRFDANTAESVAAARFPVDLKKLKGYSHACLAYLISQGLIEHFDMIYVDASHLAPDVLSDAVMSFKLLRVGGLMVFDDYLWQENNDDPTEHPKMAIDSFLNCYRRKLRVHTMNWNYQVYCQKVRA